MARLTQDNPDRGHLAIIGDENKDMPDRFVSDYATSQEQAKAADLICESVVANGAVLLQNKDNALPLKGNEKVTLFGTSAARFIYGGTGSGGMNNANATTLKDALEADGFTVTPTLWVFYREGAGAKYGLRNAGGSMNNYIFNSAEFFVNEAPQSAFTSAEWDSVKEYGDVAIMVISRVCGEGSDLPVTGAGDANGNMLSISQEERDILAKLAELKKAGSVKKIVLLLNTANAVELDILDPTLCGADYGIDATLWVGDVGQSGIRAISDLLAGHINPSGRLVDTYCYDNTTSPAIQNFYITSYYNYETRAIDMANFVREVRNDLMPAVESAYSTYAETADEAGFIASREHRAFAGYSRGCYATWHMFFNNLDYAYWFMPFSANISGAAEMSLEMPVDEQIAMLKEAIDRQAAYKDSFYIYAACGGGRDMMYDVNNALITAMLAETDYFSYGQDKTQNNLYYCLSKEIHQTLVARFYLYNAFDVVFK